MFTNVSLVTSAITFNSSKNNVKYMRLDITLKKLTKNIKRNFG